MNRFSNTPFSADADYVPILKERRDTRIRVLHRELFYLWCFIGEEGLWSDAKEYVEDHCDEPIPYEW